MDNSENISQEIWERFERYLEGRMHPAERTEFESQLESDPKLRRQLEEARNLILGIESAVLKNKLDEFHQDQIPVRTIDPSTRNSMKPWRWSIAAILILAIGLVYMLGSSNENDKIFAEHFTPDPGLPTTMSSTNNYEFLEGMVDYKQGNYDAAIKKWEVLLDDVTRTNDTLNYFLGVAHLAEKQEAEAIPYLEVTLENEASVFKDECNFYLGLAYLKAGDVENATKYLNFSQRDDAQQILFELKN